MSSRVICWSIEFGIYDSTIISPFNILILVCEIHPAALSVHCIDCIRSRKRRKQHERNHLSRSVLCDQLSKKSVARKSSFLYKSILTNTKKEKSKLIWIVHCGHFVAPYFCPVLQCNTVYYRGIFCMSLWTYLINWCSNGIISALTNILLTLLLSSSGIIIPQCC